MRHQFLALAGRDRPRGGALPSPTFTSTAQLVKRLPGSILRQ
jgi:hypothetical protein